jgi:hypothetical protein
MGMEYRGIVGFASHEPVLAACVTFSRGDIIEIGGGMYSTPLLHYLAKATGRNLVTVETCPAWAERLKVYARPFHRVFSSFEAAAAVLQSVPFGMAFVDGHENERAGAIRGLLHVPWVIVHDTEACHLSQYPGLAEALAMFNRRVDIRIPEFNNQTSVLSNTEDVKAAFSGLFGVVQ